MNVSPALKAKLKKLHITGEWDLILHLPLRYVDETHITPVADARPGDTVLAEVTVTAQEVRFRPRKQLTVQSRDAAGTMLFLRFLHFYPNQQQQLSEGSIVRALGEIRRGFHGLEMVHPKVRAAAAGGLPETLTPVYPTTAGLSQQALRKAVKDALTAVALEDTLPAGILAKLGLPALADSLKLLHNPPPEYCLSDLENPDLPARKRLVFDELLAQQLSMFLARKNRSRQHAPVLAATGRLQQPFRQNLPFALTLAQEKTVADILQDMAYPHPMHRLLQGDVGSGKTVVAAMAAVTAVENGFQAAVMAPTEILAEQHFHKFREWLEPLGIRVVRLSGSLKKKEKEAVRAAVADGTADVVVGTHALVQDDAVFSRLGLAIVDEQHRFGVDQRLALTNKGEAVHRLMMSATPIPRTLAMSFFADLDVSVIDELPPGRTPIRTKLVNSRRRYEVEALVRGYCAQGRQVYWVCPLIEESETLQLQTATDTLTELKDMLPELNIGLVHGRLKSAEKNEVMADFASGNINVLVATTVIEVGVDVPNAVLMVIEHAERMGLSQLHQLRGRVGRGGAAGTCILLFEEPLSAVAKERLKVIYEHTDGFEIAGRDLSLRGPGEFLGARQSGVPLLRFANLEEDLLLLEEAGKLAPVLAEQHPEIVEKHLSRWLAGRDAYLGG